MQSPFNDEEVGEALLAFHQKQADKTYRRWEQAQKEYDELDEKFQREDCGEDLIQAYCKVVALWKLYSSHRKQARRVARHLLPETHH